jgi:hypothetical protein
MNRKNQKIRTNTRFYRQDVSTVIITLRKQPLGHFPPAPNPQTPLSPRVAPPTGEKATVA